MLRAVPVVLVLAVLSLAVAAVPAHAVLITVNFTVATVNGTGSGSFTVDNTGFPPSGGFLGDAAVQSFDLTFGAFSWDETTASSLPTNGLRFDASGQLVGFFFGGDVNLPGGYVSNTGDFQLTTFGGGSPFGDPFGQLGSLQWSIAEPSAPEPASWLLLGGALVGMAGVRRRARK